MKTKFKLLQMENRFFRLVLSCATCFFLITETYAQEKKSEAHDFLMPQKGKSMIGFNSGIPYVAIGEFSYGFTNRFSAGIIIGHTSVLPGYGIRLKAVVVQAGDNMRIYLKSPIIYYPFTRELGGDPWILAWPTLSAEWKLKNGARVWTGIGMVGAGCVNYIFGLKDDHDPSEHANHTEQQMETKEVMADVWNTFQFGYSKSISSKLSYMVEIAPVMKGLKLANPHNWIGGPPVLLTFGLSYSL